MVARSDAHRDAVITLPFDNANQHRLQLLMALMHLGERRDFVGIEFTTGWNGLAPIRRRSSSVWIFERMCVGIYRRLTSTFRRVFGPERAIPRRFGHPVVVHREPKQRASLCQAPVFAAAGAGGPPRGEERLGSPEWNLGRCTSHGCAPFPCTVECKRTHHALRCVTGKPSWAVTRGLRTICDVPGHGRFQKPCRRKKISDVLVNLSSQFE